MTNPGSKSKKTVFYFHDFNFVLETEELFKGKKAIPIQPLAGKLLGLFLTNRQTLLSREVIQSHLWPETLVDYDTRINALVKDIRKALGDDQSGPKYIETISKKGYRFKARITDDKGSPQGLVFRFSKVGILGGLILIFAITLFAANYFQNKTNPVLLILPVQSLQNDPANPFPVDTLTSQLISKTSLMSNGSLSVIARTSAMKFKASNLTAGEIAKVFEADYVLEVSLSQRPEGLLITSSLINPENDQQTWSAEFEKTANNLFGLDQEIVSAVLENLDISSAPKWAASTEKYTPKEAAYKAYLTGLYLLGQSDNEEILKSFPFFQKAIEEDPNFALPHFQIARLFTLQDRPWEEIFPEIDQALTLDNNLADAYYLRAFYYLFEKWDWPAAEADFIKALEIEPTRARFRVGYSYFLGTLGRSTEGRKIAEQTSLVDPLSPVVNSDLGWIYLRLEDYDLAILQASRLLELAPKNRNAFEILLVAYRATGDLENAGKVALRMLESEGASESLINNLKPLSGEEQIKAVFTWRLDTNPPPLDAANYNSFIALSYLGLGNQEKALDFFEKALKNRERFLVNFMVDPRLEPLRNSPRYIEIVENIGRPNH